MDLICMVTKETVSNWWRCQVQPQSQGRVGVTPEQPTAVTNPLPTALRLWHLSQAISALTSTEHRLPLTPGMRQGHPEPAHRELTDTRHHPACVEHKAHPHCSSEYQSKTSSTGSARTGQGAPGWSHPSLSPPLAVAAVRVAVKQES